MPAQKYKLTVLEGVTKAKRGKKGRVSSEAVVKVTDENDIPVAGIAVAFSIPQMVGGGAAFTNGALTSIITTNAAGVASSGSFAAASGSAFSLSVTASVPGGAITASVPASTAALAAGAAGGAAGGGAAAGGAAAGGAAAGVSAGVIGAVVAGVAAAAIGVGLGLKGPGDKGTTSTTPRGTISGPGGVVFGPPR